MIILHGFREFVSESLNACSISAVYLTEGLRGGQRRLRGRATKRGRGAGHEKSVPHPSSAMRTNSLCFFSLQHVSSPGGHRPHIAHTSPTHRPHIAHWKNTVKMKIRTIKEMGFILSISDRAIFQFYRVFTVGDVWAMCGRCVGDVWAMCGRCPGGPKLRYCRLFRIMLVVVRFVGKP